jgi:hypothetical protein
MAVAWTLVFSSVGSALIITALFLTSNGIKRGDNVDIILLNLLGGALLTAASLGGALREEDGSDFIPFAILNGVFALIAASALARWVRKTLCDPGGASQTSGLHHDLTGSGDKAEGPAGATARSEEEATSSTANINEGAVDGEGGVAVHAVVSTRGL